LIGSSNVPFLRVSVVNGFLSTEYANRAREKEIALVFSEPSATSAVDWLFLVLSIRKVNLGGL
jgi:hypothetical protein